MLIIRARMHQDPMAYLFREYIRYFLPKTKNGWPQVALGRGKSELGIHISTDSSDTVAPAWTAWNLRQELSEVHESIIATILKESKHEARSAVFHS